MKYKATIARMYDKHPSEYFTNSWDNMLAFSRRYILKPDEDFFLTKATVSWHESGRNEIVSKARGDWTLMLDTDHMFAPDILDRLLFLKNKYNCKVIGGMYQYKFPPHNPVMNLWGENNSVISILDWDRNADILEVGSIGGGCLLVDNDVYQAIINKYNTMPFSIMPGLSEDYSFCLRCKEIGVKVHVAPKVQCHHVIETPLSIDDYRPNLPMNIKAENGIICQN